MKKIKSSLEEGMDMNKQKLLQKKIINWLIVTPKKEKRRKKEKWKEGRKRRKKERKGIKYIKGIQIGNEKKKKRTLELDCLPSNTDFVS